MIIKKLYLFKKDCDFAIRICAYLAGIKYNKPISVSKLSSKLLITKPFATKIIYSLRQSNLIRSQQGKTGGVFLNKSPREISLSDILESMGFNKTI
ncbi:MAG: Rrf2 family transcriptional regulator [Ignavibacteriae bacterium]|nr:Rrf2 family transcriptional regulator [Ignavibacteriota bacterium]